MGEILPASASFNVLNPKLNLLSKLSNTFFSIHCGDGGCNLNKWYFFNSNSCITDVFQTVTKHTSLIVLKIQWTNEDKKW